VDRFLKDCAAKGETPSYEEICCATEIGTHGEVSRIIIRLEQTGHLAAAGFVRGARGYRTRRLQLANHLPDSPVVE
jgi:hypothetical protein